VSSEQRIEVGTAFKLLYRSNLNTSQALERIAEEIRTAKPSIISSTSSNACAVDAWDARTK
jgi:acyl-[acyl carrier protein]--UDP-N-acetylglucosamine O-acyltransferase